MNRIRINVIKISSPIFSTSQAAGYTSSLGWSFFFFSFNKNNRSMKWMYNYCNAPSGEYWTGNHFGEWSQKFLIWCACSIPFWQYRNGPELLPGQRAHSGEKRGGQKLHTSWDWLFLDAPCKSFIPRHSVTKRITRSCVYPPNLVLSKRKFPHTRNDPSMEDGRGFCCCFVF